MSLWSSFSRSFDHCDSITRKDSTELSFLVGSVSFKSADAEQAEERKEAGRGYKGEKERNGKGEGSRMSKK